MWSFIGFLLLAGAVIALAAGVTQRWIVIVTAIVAIIFVAIGFAGGARFASVLPPTNDMIHATYILEQSALDA